MFAYMHLTTSQPPTLTNMSTPLLYLNTIQCNACCKSTVVTSTYSVSDCSCNITIYTFQSPIPTLLPGFLSSSAPKNICDKELGRCLGTRLTITTCIGMYGKVNIYSHLTAMCQLCINWAA